MNQCSKHLSVRMDMKKWRILAPIAVLVVFGVALLWRFDIVAVVIHRDQFDGGELGFTNGSSALIEPGSGTSIVFLKIKNATDIVLSCNSDGQLHVDKDGYIEPGPVQFMVVDVRRCEFGAVGIPTNLLDVAINLLQFR